MIAKSFARIFYRSCFNVGLPLLICDTDWIRDGDVLTVDLDTGELFNQATGQKASARPIPKTMQILLQDGGLIPHLKKHGDFALEQVDDTIVQ